MSLTICPHCRRIPGLCTCKGLRPDDVQQAPFVSVRPTLETLRARYMKAQADYFDALEKLVKP